MQATPFTTIVVGLGGSTTQNAMMTDPLAWRGEFQIPEDSECLSYMPDVYAWFPIEIAFDQAPAQYEVLQDKNATDPSIAGVFPLGKSAAKPTGQITLMPGDTLVTKGMGFKTVWVRPAAQSVNQIGIGGIFSPFAMQRDDTGGSWGTAGTSHLDGVIRIQFGKMDISRSSLTRPRRLILPAMNVVGPPAYSRVYERFTQAAPVSRTILNPQQLVGIHACSQYSRALLCLATKHISASRITTADVRGVYFNLIVDNQGAAGMTWPQRLGGPVQNTVGYAAINYGSPHAIGTTIGTVESSPVATDQDDVYAWWILDDGEPHPMQLETAYAAIPNATIALGAGPDWLVLWIPSIFAPQNRNTSARIYYNGIAGAITARACQFSNSSASGDNEETQINGGATSITLVAGVTRWETINRLAVDGCMIKSSGTGNVTRFSLSLA